MALQDLLNRSESGQGQPSAMLWLAQNAASLQYGTNEANFDIPWQFQLELPILNSYDLLF